MNWNQTQLDAHHPMTIRTADQVDLCHRRRISDRPPRSGVPLTHGPETQALFAKRCRSRRRRVAPVRLLSPTVARCSNGVAGRLRMSQCGQGAVPPSTPRVVPVTSSRGC
jgi:hypothetical protein